MINRNTGRTNPPVTTNKHLWGRLKARPGFLLHRNTLANTDAGAGADAPTPPPTHSSARKVTLPVLRIILICGNKRLRSLWILQISRLVCLFGGDKSSSVHTKLWKMAAVERSRSSQSLHPAPANGTSRLRAKCTQIPPSAPLSGFPIWLFFCSALHCWLKFFIDILNLSAVASVLSNNMKTLARPEVGPALCLPEQEQLGRQRGSAGRLKC